MCAAVRAALVDALAEACAGTLKSPAGGRPRDASAAVSSGQGEFSGHDGQALPAMLRAVAAAGYSETTDFSRVLCSRRGACSRTGSSPS